MLAAAQDRPYVGVHHGHRIATIVVGALRRTAMIASMVSDGPISGAWFTASLGEQVLVPRRRSATLDNIGAQGPSRPQNH